uniref:Uncharacterized protein n=1 Tax=Zea mays TaxID=4577 RepID=C4J8M1_MAIZE|nr:unknown [Zea mays]
MQKIDSILASPNHDGSLSTFHALSHFVNSIALIVGQTLQSKVYFVSMF